MTFIIRNEKKKKGLLYDERGAAPCKFCKGKGMNIYPKVVEIDDLYYAQCSNPKCHHSDLYEYLGTSAKRTIENWNKVMEGKQDNLI